MTPKEKAEELITKFMPHSSGNSNNNEAKQCALIALRETVWGYLDQQPIEIQNYWKEVKKEIEKL
jgi:hypothetical protein